MHKLTIMQINDIHGYIDCHPELFIENGEETFRHAGGYGRIQTIFNEARKENPDGVLALDNGDTFHGTYPAVSSQGEAIVPLVNALELDGMTAHWEFAYGPKQFQNIVSKLNYPMLACNIYDKATDELVFPPYTIIERAGLTIGVIGIAEHIVDKMMPKHFHTGIYFTLGNNELPTMIQQLREENNVDLIVVLSHFGFPQEVKLAREVAGIDILLSGHTHNRMMEPVIINDTIIMQSGSHGTFVGKLDIEIEDGKIAHFHHELIEVSEDITPDAHMQKLVDGIHETNQDMLETVIGQTSTHLHRYAQLETTMDNLLLQALLDSTGAEVAFSNGWRYGAPILAGPVTMNDIWNIIPTNPPVSKVKLTGEEILDMLEENLENTFSSNPYDQMGGYTKRTLGMNMYIKIENPKGTRIQNLFINDERIGKTRTYDVAFVTVQGVPSKYGKDRHHLKTHAIYALKNYIEKHGTVSAELRGTIQVV